MQHPGGPEQPLKGVAMVRQDLWGGPLAYNLIVLPGEESFATDPPRLDKLLSCPREKRARRTAWNDGFHEDTLAPSVVRANCRNIPQTYFPAGSALSANSIAFSISLLTMSPHSKLPLRSIT